MKEGVPIHTRRYHTAVEALLSQGQKLVKSEKDRNYLHRIAAVNLVLNGMFPRQVSQSIKESKETISRWVKTVDEKGWEALRPGPHTGGRRTKLTEDEAAQIELALQNDAKDYGYNLWSGKTLSDFIKKQFDIDLSIRSCHRLFHDLGFSFKRPRPFPAKGEEDSEAREDFKKKISQAQEAPEAIIVYQDEVHYRVQTTIAAAWAKIGSTPTVKSNPSLKGVAYSGFLMAKTGRLVVMKVDWFNYATTIEALREFRKHLHLRYGQKIYLVMDNASWHKKAKKVICSDEEYADLRESIEFIPMPPRSPDLNAIEQVWKLSRRDVTHNRYWPSLSELTDTLDDYFMSFQKPNTTLEKLCSRNYDEKKLIVHRQRKVFRPKLKC